MRVTLARGAAILWTDEPSGELVARLQRGGFTSSNRVVWFGSYDSLVRLELDPALLPPGPACTWPANWRPAAE
jgi:hypothetical protein